EAARFPLRAEGYLMGQGLSTDAVVHGVPRQLVADALSDDVSWSTQTLGVNTWPVVGSQYFLDLYNLGYARSAGLPLIDEDFVLGKHFDLVLGENTIGLGRTEEPVRRLRLRIVGMT